jgi:hypothetical protein
MDFATKDDQLHESDMLVTQSEKRLQVRHFCNDAARCNGQQPRPQSTSTNFRTMLPFAPFTRKK